MQSAVCLYPLTLCGSVATYLEKELFVLIFRREIRTIPGLCYSFCISECYCQMCYFMANLTNVFLFGKWGS